jgi:hypothetical protein
LAYEQPKPDQKQVGLNGVLPPARRLHLVAPGWHREFWISRGALLRRPLKFLASSEAGVINMHMTIPEIAAQLRMVLGVCAKADANVSPSARIYFAAAQKHCSDEQIISFWLSASSIQEHRVPMFVAKHWATRSSNFIEWMALLEDNTAPPGNN